MKKTAIATLFFCSLYLCADAPPPPSRHGEVLDGNYAPAYNAPSAVAVSHKVDGMGMSNLSFFADLAFTYWYLSEEGLKIASNGVLNTATLAYPIKAHTFYPAFQYEPGFKIGVGMIDKDEWQYRVGYTWAHTHVGANKLNSTPGGDLPAGTTTIAAGAAVFVSDDWFLQGSSGGQALAASSISSHWNLTMNIVDITGGRPYYQGKRLILSPCGGLELAFISQEMEVALSEFSAQIPLPSPQPIESHTNSQSWGIGPTAGCESKLLLPWDLYLEGKGAFSLLYTTYTTLKHSEDAAATNFNPGHYKLSHNNYHAMRPSASMELGLGWGRYLGNSCCYADLAFTYEFSIYWAQNMMRKLLDDFLTGTAPAAADLFTQGLSITGSFNF